MRETIVLCIGLLAASCALAQPPGALPATGVIANPDGRNIVVRTSPPEATAFSYKLGERICSVGNGTIFEATREVRVINGEIWYRVHIDGVAARRAVDCPFGDIDGWMVGKLKRAWVVSFDLQDVEAVAPVLSHVDGPASVTRPGPEASEASFAFLLRYLLLVVGSCAAAVVMAIEREHDIRPSQWYSPVLLLECGMLSVTNVVFTALLLDAFIQREDSSILAQAFAVFAGPSFGFVVLGFVLSAVLLKFISFARH